MSIALENDSVASFKLCTVVLLQIGTLFFWTGIDLCTECCMSTIQAAIYNGKIKTKFDNAYKIQSIESHKIMRIHMCSYDKKEWD